MGLQGSGEDELDLRGLLHQLWSGRWTIAVGTTIALAVGVAYAFLAPQWFKAEVTVALADNKANGINLGQLGGLASLAGISLPGASGSQAPVAVLKSRELVRKLIEDKNLGPILFPKTWPKIATERSDGKYVPDIRDAVDLFVKRVRTVTEDKKSGLVTLAILWKDPELAADWANELITRVNDQLQAQAIAESERNTEFLRQQMGLTSVVALQQSMGRVLETEMQKFLLAKGNREFAFKVIDVATVPKFRDSPKTLFVLLMAGAVGLFGSMYLVLLRGRIAGLK